MANLHVLLFLMKQSKFFLRIFILHNHSTQQQCIDNIHRRNVQSFFHWRHWLCSLSLLYFHSTFYLHSFTLWLYIQIGRIKHSFNQKLTLKDIKWFTYLLLLPVYYNKIRKPMSMSILFHLNTNKKVNLNKFFFTQGNGYEGKK